MADNGENKKSSGIGELFIEFNAKGLPTFLKGLNGVSAAFLLGKNAASQFAQTLTKPIKELGNTAVAVGKLSAALGTSDKNVQKLGNYFQKYGGSKEYINDLAKTQQMLFDTYQRGKRGLDTGYSLALQNAGLDPGAYRGSYDDTKRLVKDLYYATKDKSDLEANAIFRDMGWSEDWRYIFKRGGFNLDDALALPDDAIEKGQQAAENLQEFGIALKALTDLLVVKFLPPLTDFVQWFEQKTKLFIDNGDFDNFINGIEITKKNIEQTKKDIANAYNKAKDDKAGVFTPLAIAGYYLDDKQKREIKEKNSLPGINKKSIIGRPEIFNSKKQSFYSGILPLSTNVLPTGGAAPIAPDFMTTPEALAPSNISSIMQTNNINITNQNTINGINGEDAKNGIISINENDLNYTRYQIDNPAQL